MMHEKFEALKAEYGLEEFVESGYGEGDGVRAALRAGFTSVTSIEIVPEIAEEAGHYWSDENPNVTIIEKNSYDGLSLICQKSRGPILFHLDAYIPARWGYTGIADEFNTPLPLELEIIATARDAREDVIVISALSLYGQGYEKPIEGWKWLGHANSDFIEQHFGRTHNIVRDYSDIGYAIITPKDNGKGNNGSDERADSPEAPNGAGE